MLVKRLNLKDPGKRRPSPGRPQDERALFARSHTLRELVVMVDADLVEDESTAVTSGATERSLLGDLIKHPLVRTYRFLDDGPPAEITPDPAVTKAAVYDGWAVIHHRDEAALVWGVVYRAGDDGYTLAGVHGNATVVAVGDTAAGAYPSLDPAAAAERRKGDTLAADVADQALQADLYVTERDYLHRATWSITRRTTICSVREALAIIGLYLRTQDEFVVADRHSYNRGLYYWVATRELLPAAWRWFTACVRSADAVSDDAVMLLAGSLLQRVDHALRDRDAVHVALNQPQDNDVRADALSALDDVLVRLMGAFDVAARVAHRVLQLSGDEYGAGWQKGKKGGWLDRVRAVAPDLAATVDAGTDGHHALTIVRLLRNSVHGAALQGVHFIDRSRPAETLVGLPTEDEAKVLAAMDALGGRSSWGVRTVFPGRVHVDPGVLTDRLFESALPVLNMLMDRTPVEALPGVTLAPEDVGPPLTTEGPFVEWARQSIRLQLGL